MSILDYADQEERKLMLVERLIELECEDKLDKLSDDQLSDMTTVMEQLIQTIMDELDPEVKINILVDYILVLWAEMIVDLGKDSSLL